jgi:hypothetical protein
MPSRLFLEQITAGIIDPNKKNVALGLSSLRDNTTGTSNVAMGYYALILNTTGHSNTVAGDNAMAHKEPKK